MTWLDGVDRAQALRALFPDGDPSLDAIHMHELTFHRDGPSLALRFDLPAYPSEPPEKWLQAGHNTVQVTLALDGVRSVTLEGWGRDISGKLELRPGAALGFDCNFVTEGCKLTATCDFVRIAHVSGYHKAE